MFFYLFIYFFVPSSASSCTEGMHNSHSAYRPLWDDQLITTHGRMTEHRLQDDVGRLFFFFLSAVMQNPCRGCSGGQMDWCVDMGEWSCLYGNPLGPFICTDSVCKIIPATEAALPVISLDAQGNKSKDTSRTIAMRLFSLMKHLKPHIMLKFCKPAFKGCCPKKKKKSAVSRPHKMHKTWSKNSER